MPDQKIPAKPEKPHEFAKVAAIQNGNHYCLFCRKSGNGANLETLVGRTVTRICRACIRLALWRMAEIPEGQS